MDRASELLEIYKQLRGELDSAEGSSAANIGRELRLILAELERLGAGQEVGLVDELAVKRAGAGVGRPPARRKS